MTGFGKAEGNIGNKKFTVEVRSLNSKQLDLNMRMPSIYREKELEMRSWLSDNIQRGKADMLIYYESMEAEKRMSINKPLMMAYYQDLKEVADAVGMTGGDFMNALIRIPDIMKPENAEVDEEEWKNLMKIVKEAYARFDEYRKAEGAKLKDDFALGIVDKDKRPLSRTAEFALLTEKQGLKLYKHQQKHHYLIFHPPIEQWILNEAHHVGIALSDDRYRLPITLKGLIDEKNEFSKHDPRFTCLFRDLKTQNAIGINLLAKWVEYLKANPYNADKTTLQNL